tara:strand:+ start:5562 stop:6296 length:735 start_codon:yes stop_codon:yes gene_type:complete
MDPYDFDVIETARKIAKQCTGGYRWEKGGPSTTGTCIDIEFEGTMVLKATSDKSTYCSGFSFSTFFITALYRNLLDDKTAADIKKMQRIWYSGKKPSLKLSGDAIVDYGLGKEVTLEEAKPGDFCQIWRTGGSGHSVMFISHIKSDDKIIGIKYYGSNSSTKGPGENTEYFSDAVTPSNIESYKKRLIRTPSTEKPYNYTSFARLALGPPEDIEYVAPIGAVTGSIPQTPPIVDTGFGDNSYIA